MDAVRRVAPDVPAVACFDTAFHASLGPEAARYALPDTWVERGVLRRYGFHGLSCEWSVGRAAALLERPIASIRLVICHLGGGASATAVAGGRSVDTTMGFTPTEGLVMATRPGDVDPGAIAWLAAQGVTPAELVDGLERRSGLLALSGGTSDMRALLQRRATGDPAATGAVDVYLHRLRAKIAAMCAATDGTDVLVFTGGVGENAGGIRAAVCERLGWLGISIVPDLNTAVDGEDADISPAGAPVRTLVIHAREELVIAAGCRAVLGGAA
jgi:acetate kinase